MEIRIPSMRFGRIAAMCCLATLSACATASLPEQMVIAPGAIAPATSSEPGYQQIHVDKVEGGAKTNPLLTSQVAPEDFRTALEASLRELRLLAPNPDKASLQVTAYILGLNQPMMGLDLTVTSTVHYRVVSSAGGAPVFDETVAASGTASLGSALVGVERLRKANEAAIRANIQSFVERLRLALKAAPAT